MIAIVMFWCCIGLGFGYWATEHLGAWLKTVYMSGHQYEWLYELYIYCLMNGFFAMLVTGLPFYLIGIYFGAKFEKNNR